MNDSKGETELTFLTPVYTLVMSLQMFTPLESCTTIIGRTRMNFLLFPDRCISNNGLKRIGIVGTSTSNDGVLDEGNRRIFDECLIG